MSDFYVIRSMKSPDYAKVKHLIETGYIKELPAALNEFTKKSTVYKDIGIAYETFVRRERDPGMWNVEELSILGNLLEIDPAILFTMADRARKKKAKK